jgi:hypothetical protein
VDGANKVEIGKVIVLLSQFQTKALSIVLIAQTETIVEDMSAITETDQIQYKRERDQECGWGQLDAMRRHYIVKEHDHMAIIIRVPMQEFCVALAIGTTEQTFLG